MELDPYWKWLGIPPDQQPADHYTLLGIARFETDEDVIENAAVRQMTHVRSFQGGQHVALSQQLLNELSTARLCLLNDEQKRVYDQQLQDQQPAGEGPATALPVTAEVTQAGQLPVAQEVAPQSSQPAKTPRRSRRRRQRRHANEARMAWTIVLFVVVALLVCVCIGIFVARSSGPGKKSDVHSLRVHHLSLANHPCLHNVC